MANNNKVIKSSWLKFKKCLLIEKCNYHLTENKSVTQWHFGSSELRKTLLPQVIEKYFCLRNILSIQFFTRKILKKKNIEFLYYPTEFNTTYIKEKNIIAYSRKNLSHFNILKIILKCVLERLYIYKIKLIIESCFFIY